jgi:hypothetical protein
MKAVEWIKKEDRLPEAIERHTTSEFVLVAWEINYIDFECVVRGATVAQFCYARKQWFNRDGKRVIGVTHWMPIVLPKEEDEE